MEKSNEEKLTIGKKNDNFEANISEEKWFA